MTVSATRPKIRSAICSIASPSSRIRWARMPSVVPQSTRLDDDVLSDVAKTSRQVARVRRSKSGVGKTLTSSVSRHEVLEHVQALVEASS